MDKIEIVDKRRHPFTIIDNRVLDVNGKLLPEILTDKWAMTLLAICYSKQNNVNYIPSLNYISHKLGINRNALTKSIKHLEALSLLQVIHRKGFKSKIILLPIEEAQQKQKISETELVDYVMKNYQNFTPRTRDMIFSYLSDESDKLLPHMENMREQLDTVREKIKLVR